MSAQEYFIISPAQRDIAVGFNTPDVAVEPRAVDGISPGAGLAGKYVAPKRIADDPEYLRYAPGMVAFLLTLPYAALDTETIFAPPQRD